jgi:hypothetical protein
MSEHPYEAEVAKLGKTTLVGRKIIGVRHMTAEEAEQSGWDSRPPVLILDDGNWIAPMSDDEGNDGGAFATSYAAMETIAVLR